MEYIFIVILVIIIAIVGIKIINPNIQKNKLRKNLIDFLNKENLFFQESKSKSNLFDMKVVKENITIYIKFVIVPTYAEVQVNNMTTWEVKYGAGDTVGKVQPHKRYLTEIVPFMKQDFGENTKKLVIFSPTPKKIVKYLNENEIDFVKSTTDVYGANITSFGKYTVILKY